MADVVKDVDHQRAISGAHLVYDQVLIRGVGDFVVLYQVSSHSFAIIWTEEFRRGMP